MFGFRVWGFGLFGALDRRALNPAKTQSLT